MSKTFSRHGHLFIILKGCKKNWLCLITGRLWRLALLYKYSKCYMTKKMTSSLFVLKQERLLGPHYGKKILTPCSLVNLKDRKIPMFLLHWQFLKSVSYSQTSYLICKKS